MAAAHEHPSHPHALELMGMLEGSGKAADCGACGLPISSGNLYGCQSCSFFLHCSCALLYSPSLQKHPAHPRHVLSLFYKPAYTTRCFRCNICGNDDEGWHYRCTECNFDAHFLCAHMPLVARTRGHQHPLHLLFHPPTKGNTHCDACGLQIHHCCYRCSRCGFVLHQGCLTEPQATDDSKGKRSKRVMAWRLTKLVARKTAMHILLDAFGGLAEPVDFLLFGSEDVVFVYDILRNLYEAAGLFAKEDVCHERISFGDRFGADAINNPLVAEAFSLVLAHVQRTGAGTGSCSPTRTPSTISDNGRQERRLFGSQNNLSLFHKFILEIGIDLWNTMLQELFNL